MDIHAIVGRVMRKVGEYFEKNETMTGDDWDRIQREANPLSHLYSVFVSRSYNRQPEEYLGTDGLQAVDMERLQNSLLETKIKKKE